MAKQTVGQYKPPKPAPPTQVQQTDQQTGDQQQQPPQQDTKEKSSGGKVKAWRAKVDCTYNGRLVNKGEIVHATDLKNEHFEEVQG